MVKPSDFARGTITCSHPGCGTPNSLQVTYYYDDRILIGLPEFGALVSCTEPSDRYLLKAGTNIIGVGEQCHLRLKRYLHGGRCFISRHHCMLNVTFDEHAGKLRYQLSDGVVEGPSRKSSLNGTRLEGILLQKDEVIDVPPGGIIQLGGTDSFRLEAYTIPQLMLDSYRVTAAYDPDSTQ